MTTVVWLGRVRRGTELTTLRKVGLDCRLFFDTETAERFILHHGSAQEKGSCPIFAIVGADVDVLALFQIQGIQEIIQRHGIHAVATVPVKDLKVQKEGSDLSRFLQTPSNNIFGSSGSGSFALTGPQAQGSGLTPKKSLMVTNTPPSTIPGFSSMTLAGSTVTTTTNTGTGIQPTLSNSFTLGTGPQRMDTSELPTLVVADDSQPNIDPSASISTVSRTATGSEQASLTATASTSGGSDPQPLSHHGTVTSSAGGEESFDQWQAQLKLPEYVRWMSGDRVQEELAKRFRESIMGKSDGQSDMSAAMANPAVQSAFLQPMQQLAVPAPEGVPPTATFVGEGPSGSVWRLAAEEDQQQKAADLALGVHVKRPDVAIRVLPASLQGEPYYTILAEQMTLRHPKISIPLRVEPLENPKRVFHHLFRASLEQNFRGEPVPETVAIRALYTVLDVMKEIHQRGFFFRSVTPYSVAFDHDNVIRVTANYLMPERYCTHYKEWLILTYCAPESIATDVWSRAGDIWGVGCLALRMLYGQNPWLAKEPDRAVARTMVEGGRTGDDKSLMSFLALIPEKANPLLANIVRKCLKLDPKKRPSASELLNDELFAEMRKVVGSSSTSAGLNTPTLSTSPEEFRVASDQELDHASYRVSYYLRRDSSEFAKVQDAVGKAVLKQSDVNSGVVEVLGVAKLENDVLKKRFEAKAEDIGKRGIAFFGCPPEALKSVYRYGVLRAGHRLNPLDGGNPATAMWAERGTVAHPKHGVYVAKYPSYALKFTSKEGLAIGSVADVIMFEVAFGDSQLLPKGERGLMTSAQLQADPHHSFIAEQEVFLKDETQLNPVYVLRLRTCAPMVSVPSLRTYYHIMSNRDLGKGSFGSVKLAIQYPQGLPVAVKIFDIQTSDEALCKAEFDTLLRLSDFRHIMRVNHYEIKGDTAFMFMELLTTSLLDLIKGFGPMREEVVRHYMIQAAAGLESLRLEGLVHRDVKPANMMLAFDGTLKLTDFGLSHEVIGETFASGTVGGLPVGSPAYWSPELLHGHPHTPASDVWALAASAVHMLSGAVPYKELGPLQVVQLAFVIGSGSAVPTIPDHVSPTFRAVLERCFSPQPEDRPSLQFLVNPGNYGFGSPTSTNAGTRVSSASSNNERQDTNVESIVFSNKRSTDSWVVEDEGDVGGGGGGGGGLDGPDETFGVNSYDGNTTGTWASSNQSLEGSRAGYASLGVDFHTSSYPGGASSRDRTTTPAGLAASVGPQALPSRRPSGSSQTAPFPHGAGNQGTQTFHDPNNNA